MSQASQAALALPGETALPKTFEKNLKKSGEKKRAAACSLHTHKKNRKFIPLNSVSNHQSRTLATRGVGDDSSSSCVKIMTRLVMVAARRLFKRRALSVTAASCAARE
jgi:hypothetical protein